MLDATHILSLPLKMPSPDHLGDEDLQEYFQKCKEKLGFIPNVLRAYSHNIKRLRNFVNLYNELMSGDSTIPKVLFVFTHVHA